MMGLTTRPFSPPDSQMSSRRAPNMFSAASSPGSREIQNPFPSSLTLSWKRRRRDMGESGNEENSKSGEKKRRVASMTPSKLDDALASPACKKIKSSCVSLTPRIRKNEKISEEYGAKNKKISRKKAAKKSGKKAAKKAKKRGVVMVGTKPGRGSKGSYPERKGFVRIDVTSGSMNKILQGRDAARSFSPMYLGPVAGPPSAKIFENFWQFGKVFKELGHLKGDGSVASSTVTRKFIEFRRKGYDREKGKRRPPEAKTNIVLSEREGRRRYKYLIPKFGHYFGKNMGYIKSRKEVYCPEYTKLITPKPAFHALKKRLENGDNFMILDLDGPKDMPEGEVVSLEMLRRRINDPTQPFGHGFVMAAALAGISVKDYCI